MKRTRSQPYARGNYNKLYSRYSKTIIWKYVYIKLCDVKCVKWDIEFLDHQARLFNH
jgi:hypothetical protein